MPIQDGVIRIMPADFNLQDWQNGTFKAWDLPDAIYARANDEINGSVMLTLIYSTTGENAEQILAHRIIVTNINNYDSPQLMRIISVKKTLSKAQIEVKAEHITCDVRQFYITVAQFSKLPNITSQSLWNSLKIAITPNTSERKFPYQFTSDTSMVANIDGLVYRGVNLLEIMGGIKGSFLDIWGGEYRRDNLSISHVKRLGTDRGYRIEYGMNLKDVEFSVDSTNTFYGVAPFVQWNDQDGSQRLRILDGDGFIIGNSTSKNYYSTAILPLDVSDKFKEPSAATQTQIRAEGNLYLTQNPERFLPSVNLKVNFVSLSDKKEYDGIRELQNLMLGDDVQVKYGDFGLDVKTRLISYEYDILSKTYTKLELGQPKSTFLKQMNDQYSLLYHKAFGINNLKQG